ncbi:MAG: RnfH family protein [Betaproteobacteria bacterium]|jgi:putative ubiquitin-RnfH superfamily antitoxin RatB of RatAB toxin-antitoxin module
MVSDGTIAVTVLYSPGPRVVTEVALRLTLPCTVQQALQASGFGQSHPELDLSTCPVGVWGRKAARGQPLRDRDRVEIYRALTVDPKLARRERFARQGARTAGLFAKKRPGSKAGY